MLSAHLRALLVATVERVVASLSTFFYTTTTETALRIGLKESTFMSSEIVLQTPPSFDAFPYQPPYPIQVDLMRHLFDAIEEKKVALVESPTGTVCALNSCRSCLSKTIVTTIGEDVEPLDERNHLALSRQEQNEESAARRRPTIPRCGR